MLLNELTGSGATVSDSIGLGVLYFSQIIRRLTLGKSFNLFET